MLFNEHTKNLLTDAIEGKVIQRNTVRDGWVDMSEDEFLKNVVYFKHFPENFRAKPHAIKIGDDEVEIPIPISKRPSPNEVCYVVCPTHEHMCHPINWRGTTYHSMLLARGLLHSTATGAISHSKALLRFTSHEDEDDSTFGG